LEEYLLSRKGSVIITDTYGNCEAVCVTLGKTIEDDEKKHELDNALKETSGIGKFDHIN
jgi:hypothetical protein